MYQVFVKNLQSDKGKEIVQYHEATFDAQVIYNELLEQCKQSTTAQLSSSELITYSTSVRINDGSWRGTTSSFILHWIEQVRLYESTAAKNEHFLDGQKRTILENLVSSHNRLRTIKTQADQVKALNGSVLTYAQYNTLLQSSANIYDASLSGSNKKYTRSVYMSEQLDNTEQDDLHNNEDTQYDIDSPIDMIQANVHQNRPSFHRPSFLNNNR